MSLAVIIASCNRENRAFETAQSLLDTGLAEVILVDDGSSTPYQSRVRHERLSLLRLHVNSGPSAARNHGVRNTQAEWVIFLDDDDSLESGLTDWVQKNTQNTLKDYDLVHFGHRLVNQENPTINDVTISTNVKPCVLSGSWMMRRQFFLDIGGYEERLRYSENTDLIDRTMLAGARTLHAGFTTLSYTIGRPKRRKEMAARRAEGCLFYIKHRPLSDKKSLLRIGILNAWWDRNIFLIIKILLAYILSINKH